MDANDLYTVLKTHLEGHDAILREAGIYNVGIEIKRFGEVECEHPGTKDGDLFIQRQNGKRDPYFPTGLWVRPGNVDRVEVIEPLTGNDRKIVRLYGGDKVRTFEVTT